MATAFCRRLEKQNGSEQLLSVPIISLNMDVLFTPRTHTREEEMCICVYSCSACVGVHSENEYVHARGYRHTGVGRIIFHPIFLYLLCDLVSVFGQGAFWCPWGLFGPRCPACLAQHDCFAASCVNRRAPLSSDTVWLLY